MFKYFNAHNFKALFVDLCVLKLKHNNGFEEQLYSIVFE